MILRFFCPSRFLRRSGHIALPGLSYRFIRLSCTPPPWANPATARGATPSRPQFQDGMAPQPSSCGQMRHMGAQPLRLSHFAPRVDLQLRMVRTAVFSGRAPGQVIAATASASMTGGRLVPSPAPSDALGMPV